MALNAADKKFLKEMIPHHKLAVKMAEIVMNNGTDAKVDLLAKGIIDGQSQEIKKMEKWLAEVGETPNSTMGQM